MASWYPEPRSSKITGGASSVVSEPALAVQPGQGIPCIYCFTAPSCGGTICEPLVQHKTLPTMSLHSIQERSHHCCHHSCSPALVLVSLGQEMPNWCLERRHRNSKHLLDQVTVLAESGATGHFALCSATACRGGEAVAGAPSPSSLPADC